MTVSPARIPDVPAGSLGLGLDLPWGAPIGLVRDPAGGDRPTDRLRWFLERHRGTFDAAFVSWQPRGRGRVRAADHFAALDAFWATCDAPFRGLHHTALNLATDVRYDRGALLEMTEGLIARYGFRWVNEDLGLWSLGGKPLPYPLPPMLTDAGLRACIRNVGAVQSALSVPLVVEFPGFSEGVSLCVGPWDAYDYFRRVVEETGSPCTLDVGHLISWRWMRGFRGAALFDDLHFLPLDHCVELHLSGCSVVRDKWCDAHHGLLRPEQLTLTERLIAACPNLRLITIEDPKFDAEGVLLERTLASFEAAVRLVRVAARAA